jgi:hypothetical protein
VSYVIPTVGEEADISATEISSLSLQPPTTSSRPSRPSLTGESELSLLPTCHSESTTSLSVTTMSKTTLHPSPTLSPRTSSEPLSSMRISEHRSLPTSTVLPLPTSQGNQSGRLGSSTRYKQRCRITCRSTQTRFPVEGFGAIRMDQDSKSRIEPFGSSGHYYPSESNGLSSRMGTSIDLYHMCFHSWFSITYCLGIDCCWIRMGKEEYGCYGSTYWI